MSQPQENQEDMNAYLVINSQIYQLNKQITRIGRKLENDLVIKDPLISRNHAEIRIIGDTYTLIDLSSTTGTHINNKRVQQHQLVSGDLFYLANIPIMFIKDSDKLQTGSNKTTGSLKLE
jgi:pSer/pThr/pTyr-binding forkhead associated (FHA) protein